MADQEIKLTLIMLEQIQSYVDHRDDPDHGGWYYGNREQFEKRHKTIKAWLATEIVKAGKIATPGDGPPVA